VRKTNMKMHPRSRRAKLKRQNSADQKTSQSLKAALVAMHEDIVATTLARQWAEVEWRAANGFHVDMEKLCAK
jgi:hypothetical protein